MTQLFTIITLFPEMFTPLQAGITGRALEQKKIALKTINPREYAQNRHRTVDDRPYGGGPGMVMRFPPLQAAIKAAKQDNATASVIYMSPQGRPLQQTDLARWRGTPLILLCGRYEGIDQRVIDHLVDEEVSIGDYVLSGGELPAMVLIDAITRTLDGALGHPESADADSFSHGLLDHPHYTRPLQTDAGEVPEILISGDHDSIKRWRLQQSLINTWQKRKDLLKRRTFTPLEQELLAEFTTINSQSNDEESQ